MIVVTDQDIVCEEVPPHDGTGLSTVFPISAQVPDRRFEFRRRILHKGAAIGRHVLGHDEIYYVLSGEGIVSSDTQTAPLAAGMSAYLYQGAEVGIAQTGEGPLELIIAYPLPI